MAIYRWTGAEDTVWKDGRNWIDTDGNAFDQNNYPTVDIADEAWFDAAVTNAPVGVDLTAENALKVLKVSRDYDQDIASTGAYLQVEVYYAPEGTNVAECIIDGESAGDIFLKGDSAGNGIRPIRVVNVKTDSTLYLDGKIGDMNILKGTVVINAGATLVGTCQFGYIDSKVNDATVTITAGATLPADIEVAGGTITNNSTDALTTLRMGDGKWIQSGDATISTLTTHGGNFQWDAGTLTIIHLFGGKVDGSKSMTARNFGTCYLHKSGTLDLDNGMRNIGITGKLVYLGGTPVWCLGQEFTTLV